MSARPFAFLRILLAASAGGPKGEGFEVVKTGDARVAMIGFPSVGKSTVLNRLTETRSAVASYEFTTLCAIPGVIQYKGANIQLVDLPGIIEVCGALDMSHLDSTASVGASFQGASEGKGRGRQVVATAKTADLVLMILDAANGDRQRELLEVELDKLGLRHQPPYDTERFTHFRLITLYSRHPPEQASAQCLLPREKRRWH